jgi:hypothetical protein
MNNAIKLRVRLQLNADNEQISTNFYELTDLFKRCWDDNFWEMISCDWFTGILDSNGIEIYENDIDAAGNKVERCNGSWCLNGDRPLTNKFTKFGTIYE